MTLKSNKDALKGNGKVLKGDGKAFICKEEASTAEADA